MTLQKFRELQIGRFELFLVFAVYLPVVLLQGSTLFFFVYANVTPEWRCGAEEDWSQNCTIFRSCVGNISFRAPFHSARQEFGLICDSAYIGALISSLQFAGLMVGANIFGYVSDRFGRQKPLACAAIFEILSGLASSVVQTATWLAVTRFLCGVFCGGELILVIVYILELTKPQQRMFMRAAACMPTIKVVLALIAWAVRDWRWLIRTVSLMSIPLPLILLFVAPESLKWARDRAKRGIVDRAQSRVARLRGTPSPSVKNEMDILSHSDGSAEIPSGIPKETSANNVEKSSKSTKLILCKTPILRQRLCTMCIMWTAAVLTTYVVMFDGRNLAGNLNLNQALMGIFGISAYVAVFFVDTLIPGFNRRIFHQLPQLAVCALSGAAALLLSFRITGEWRSLVSAIAITINFFVSFLWNAVYIGTGEIFPTEVRAMAYGVCNLFARMALILVPQIIFLRELWEPGPYVVITVAGLLALLLSYLYLPDTKGRALPSDEQQSIALTSRKHRKGQPNPKEVELLTS